MTGPAARSALPGGAFGVTLAIIPSSPSVMNTSLAHSSASIARRANSLRIIGRILRALGERARAAVGSAIRYTAPSMSLSPAPLSHRFCTAPMMDWSDRHCRFFFRQLSRHALLYTEMVTTGALLHGDVARHLDFDAAERPVALQLGGSEPDELATARSSANAGATTRSTSTVAARRNGSGAAHSARV